jgi:DNA-binding transcriptional regulator LsrR (DeoR family)
MSIVSHKVQDFQRLAVKVCRLFYEQNLTKTEIEKRLHISRFKVARILEAAKKGGLVRIEIVEPHRDLSDLEKALESAFNLKSAVLVWDGGDSPKALKEKVGNVAADYLLGILRDGDVLGIGWGTTTYELVKALPDAISTRVHIVQVSGGNTSLESGIDSQALTMSLASKFGVEPYLLHAPTLVDRPETRYALMQESALKQIFRMYRKINILIAGIGAFLPNRFLGTLFLGESEMRILRKNKAVGEFLSYCYDIQGRLCHKERLKRVIAIPPDIIKRVPYSIAIVVGYEKAEAVLGAIRVGLINTLITDTTTARTLLNNNQAKEVSA